MPFPPLPPSTIDPKTGHFRLNAPVFLLHLVRSAVIHQREKYGRRVWDPRVWWFVIGALRDRRKANEKE